MRKQSLLTAVNHTLKVWTYLRDHPEINTKDELPDYLYSTIRNLEAECPLCEIFSNFNRHGIRICKNKVGVKCPLYKCYVTHNHVGLYEKWGNAFGCEERAKYAGKIVNRLLQWKKADKVRRDTIKFANRLWNY
jgi:hypothetical protein